MIKVKYYSTQEIVQSPNVNLILLIDEMEKRQLVIVTDKFTALGITAMYDAQANPNAKRDYFDRSALCVLLSMLPTPVLKMMHIEVETIINGQYIAYLIDRSGTYNKHELRISEAVLLSVVSHIPIYVEEHLWYHQSTPFNKAATGTSIPANTLPLPMLQSALKQAVAEEKYELAKTLKDEMDNRFPGQGEKQSKQDDIN